MEDSLIDILCMKISSSPLSSIEDAKVLIRTSVPTLVQGYDALLASGATDRIAVKMMLFSIGKPVPLGGALGKLVRGAKLSDKYVTPLVNMYHVGKEARIVVRLPELQQSDTLSMRSLEAILTLLHYTTGIKPENMSYTMEKDLGQSMVFDALSVKMLEELTSSATSPSGVYPGEVIKLGDYKCNIPTILSTLHLLSRKQNFIRKRTSTKGSKVFTVTSSELRKIFNIRCGLGDKSNSYSVKLLKSALSVICSTKNRVFPGGWIQSSRSLNNVKGDSGLLYKLGYTERVPYNHKVDTIIFHDTTTNPKGACTLRNKSSEEEYKTLSFLEFRTAVSLTAPRLKVTANETFDSQSKREPLSVKSEEVLENYNTRSYYKLNDSLNKAHALYSSLGQGNSKTKPVHYEIARNELLHMSSKVPIKDGLGNSYSKISDLPVPILEYCCKRFRFSISKGKRSIEETQEESMDIEVAQIVEPPEKKVLSVPLGEPPASLGGLSRSTPSSKKKGRAGKSTS
jgi:hypothetical protein